MIFLSLIAVAAAATLDACASFVTINGGSMVGMCGLACGPTPSPQDCNMTQFTSYPTTPAATAQFRWGTAPPGSENKQAGFGYAPVVNETISLTAMMPTFSCGTLSHYNYPTMSGTAGSGFIMMVNVKIDSVMATIAVPFNFTEVPNDPVPCPYGGTAGCSDVTVFANDGIILTGEAAMKIANVDYLLQVYAFGSVATPKRQFISTEGATTSTQLVCRLGPACPASCPSGQPRAVLLADGSKVCGCTDAVTTGISINFGNTTAPTTAPAGPCAVLNGTDQCNSLNCCFCSCSYVDNGIRSLDKFCLTKAGGANVAVDQCDATTNRPGMFEKCTVTCATAAPTPMPTPPPTPTMVGVTTGPGSTTPTPGQSTSKPNPNSAASLALRAVLLVLAAAVALVAN